ncbi:MAG: hypothetical protein AB7P02_29195 [Alphaproteobacteria bacterium]
MTRPPPERSMQEMLDGEFARDALDDAAADLRARCAAHPGAAWHWVLVAVERADPGHVRVIGRTPTVPEMVKAAVGILQAAAAVARGDPRPYPRDLGDDLAMASDLLIAMLGGGTTEVTDDRSAVLPVAGRRH